MLKHAMGIALSAFDREEIERQHDLRDRSVAEEAYYRSIGRSDYADRAARYISSLEDELALLLGGEL